jgi:curved DNA-binding protein CbpA
MAMGKNYYSILGVPQNATARQVRQRFLTVARQRHPDKFQGKEKEVAELEFQLVTEAFNTLSDIERRRQHDIELAQPIGSSDSDTAQVSRLYVQRAKEELQKGNHQQAVQYLDIATQEDEENHNAWFELAKVLLENRRALPRARVAITRACELQPMEPDYLKLAGDLFADSGMADRAEDYYQRALDWGGENAVIEEKLKSLRRGARGLFGRNT